MNKKTINDYQYDENGIVAEEEQPVETKEQEIDKKQNFLQNYIDNNIKDEAYKESFKYSYSKLWTSLEIHKQDVDFLNLRNKFINYCIALLQSNLSIGENSIARKDAVIYTTYNKGKKDLLLVVMIDGYYKMCNANNLIITTSLVKENEEFNIDYPTLSIRHKSNFKDTKSNTIGCYAIVRNLVNDKLVTIAVEYMDIDYFYDAFVTPQTSKMSNHKLSPYYKWQDMMFKKTVVKRATRPFITQSVIGYDEV